jgi:hypothetical protein
VRQVDANVRPPLAVLHGAKPVDVRRVQIVAEAERQGRLVAAAGALELPDEETLVGELAGLFLSRRVAVMGKR